ncbi:MAG: diacylglycerol kinase family lipid kinase [Bacteroidales bacterium]|nr:diacylglycerol kinase family lipid kinase [Bacteroidales bacterium]
MNATRGKWVFIINPVAGNGSAGKMAPEIEKIIKKYNINGQLVMTERPGHATELSGTFYENGYDHFICVGGDGTMNEMVRPLINRKDLVVGIIPAGTGNDFSQITGFHGPFEDAGWELFFRENIIAMDVGTVNDKIFLNGMGLGFDAEVAAQNYTEQGEVKKGGASKYIWHIVKTLLFFREKKMIVSSNGDRSETDCFINTIANGRRFAGGFLLTPEALANDGLLDVCSIKRLNLIQRFRLLLKVPKGEHIKDAKVRYYQTSEIELEFPDQVPFHVDGELFFSKKFRVTVLPGALNIIYNPDGNHFFRQ